MKGRSRAAAQQRREQVFAALRALLLDRPWGEVTLEAVANDAGVSRQTLYNSFGSRSGLAQAYTFHLADALCEVIDQAIRAHPDDPRRGIEDGLTLYLDLAGQDPLFARVRAGDAHADLIRLVTADAGPLIARVAQRLEEVGRNAWTPSAGIAPERIAPLAATLARLALSYAVTPPEDDASPAAVAAGLASVLVPGGQ